MSLDKTRNKKQSQVRTTFARVNLYSELHSKHICIHTYICVCFVKLLQFHFRSFFVLAKIAKKEVKGLYVPTLKGKEK